MERVVPDPSTHLSPGEALSSSEDLELARRHAASCAECARLLQLEEESFAWFAQGLPDVPPPTAVWDRLSRSIATPFWETLAARFGARIATVTDLAEEQVRALLARWEDASLWSEAGPGVSIFHFEGGPATAGAITGFVRIDAGGVFPEHRHLGHEWNLVMRGGLALPGGRVAHEGELIEMEPGTSHALAATAEQAVEYLAVALEGIAIDDAPLGPDDPRA